MTWTGIVLFHFDCLITSQPSKPNHLNFQYKNVHLIYISHHAISTVSWLLFLEFYRSRNTLRPIFSFFFWGGGGNIGVLNILYWKPFVLTWKKWKISDIANLENIGVSVRRIFRCAPWTKYCLLDSVFW